MRMVTRLQAARNRAVMACGTAGKHGGRSGAWAQCTDNFNYVPQSSRCAGSAQNAFPLGRGASIPAFLSTINTINTAFLTQTTAFVSAPGNPLPTNKVAVLGAARSLAPLT